MVTREKCRLPRFPQVGMIALMCSIFSSIPSMAADAKGMNAETPSQAEQTNPQQMIRASKIVDQPVYNERGEWIGEVDDLIMSRNGKIKKVILSVGGFLRTGEKLVTVPFRSLKGSDEGHIVYNATKEQLKCDRRFSYWAEGLYGRPFYPFTPFPLMGWDGGMKLRLLPSEGSPYPSVERENAGESFARGNGSILRSVYESARCWIKGY